MKKESFVLIGRFSSLAQIQKNFITNANYSISMNFKFKVFRESVQQMFNPNTQTEFN